MPKSPEKTNLYRLIEAGLLARQKLLVPLHANGLQQGDDAVLLGLSEQGQATIQDIQNLTGLDAPSLAPRLSRLLDQQIICLVDESDEKSGAITLTKKGKKIAKHLHDVWALLDEALVSDLGHADKKGLRKTLKRFVKILDF